MSRLARLTEQISMLEDANHHPINTQQDFDQAAAISGKLIELRKLRESLIKAIERLRAETEH